MWGGAKARVPVCNFTAEKAPGAVFPLFRFLGQRSCLFWPKQSFVLKALTRISARAESLARARASRTDVSVPAGSYLAPEVVVDSRRPRARAMTRHAE